MSLLDNVNQPTPAPPTNAQREFRIRQVAGNLRDALKQSTTAMKRIAQNGDGVSALATQLNATNAGDAAEFQGIFADAKALLARLDQAASDEVGTLS